MLAVYCSSCYSQDNLSHMMQLLLFTSLYLFISSMRVILSTTNKVIVLLGFMRVTWIQSQQVGY